MINQHRFYQNGTCFRSLNPSSGVYRLEIYRKMHRVAISILVGYHKFTKKFSSSGIAILFHKYPLLFLVLWFMPPVPYTCKSLFMLGCLRCFHLVSGFRRFSRYIFFTGRGCLPHAQPPTWRTRVSHLVWVVTLTCLAWEALPVAMLLPAELSGSFDHASPNTTSKQGYFGWGVRIRNPSKRAIADTAP